ncbi:MAG: hypothetical protein AAFY20_19685, partial [Cyanobacteria bacterium J06639_14]
PLARGTIGGAIASVAAGTPPPTAPPLGKGRTGNVTVLEIPQLVPNGQQFWARPDACAPRIRG